MASEISDAAGVLVDNYAKRAARLMTGDVSALTDAPINSSIVEMMRNVVQVKKTDLATIGAFFRSEHFAAVPVVQLSAPLFRPIKSVCVRQ